MFPWWSAAEELVMLPRAGAAGSKYEGFRLMHEGGRTGRGAQLQDLAEQEQPGK